MIDLKGKEVCVIGLGVSGFAACELLLAQKAKLKISEINDSPRIRDKLKVLDKKEINYEIGKHSENFILSCDLLVVSPGVRFDLPVLQKAKRKKIPIISEIELASWFCPSKIIAVTGTNGKTTTVKLITHLLKEKFNVYAGGNLDMPFEVPFSSFVRKLSAEDITVLELSSFQLKNTLYFKPYISLVLNITADHLNRHKDMRDYVNSKMKIFSNQKRADFAVVNAHDQNIMKEKNRINSQFYCFSLSKPVLQGTYISGEDIIFSKEGISETICKRDVFSLPGGHNSENCLAAVTSAKILGLNKFQIRNRLKTFKNVEHRLEKVGEIKGIEFINDSKSTNAACLEKALIAIPSPILLILGGLDKGNDYSRVKKLVKEKVKSIFTIGESREKIENAFKNIIPVFICETLEGAAKRALTQAGQGDKILLSPACASFDMFKDYKDRGRQFKGIFSKIKKEHE